MSLAAGRGPISRDPTGRFEPPLAAGAVFVEPHPRRIVAVRDGDVVIDTERALLVHRAGSPLTYVFPADLLAEGAAAALPREPEPAAPDHVRVPWDAVDEWYEEGRRLVHYPPNPYHRVDCRPTRRRLHVAVAADDAPDAGPPVVLVDTEDTVVLFETSLAPRLYVRADLVRTDLLRPSDTRTYCNYKGWATYWDAVVGDRVVADVAWSYEDPLPESEPIRGHLSFDPDRARVGAALPGHGPPGA